jgi:hypothetical protein
LDILFLRPRRFFLATLWRMIAPLQPISFADFLLADFLTSLAKSVSDVERAVCSMVTGPVLAAAADAAAEFRCGSASWHIPMALALPYLIRLSQCIRCVRRAVCACGCSAAYLTPHMLHGHV